MAVSVLLLLLAAVTAISWRRWGLPFFDAGLDLSIADRIAHDGTLPYADARYFYGPLGLYTLAGAFKVFGTSLTVAFVFGYVQTLAILGAFYVLARSWLSSLGAAVATALLLSIAFSGTFFDFVLPHTNAGTFGCLALIMQVLAVTRGRYGLAGIAAGLACLTRVEFVLFAGVVVLGALLGIARDRGWRAAFRALMPLAAPAVIIPVAVYGAFAQPTGLHRLIYENLIPVDFARFGGGKLQTDWAPLNVSSMVAAVIRALIVLIPATGFVWSVVEWRRRHGVRALIPFAASLVLLVVAAGAWKVTGVFPGGRANITDEVKRSLIAMSWLPVPAVAAFVWVLVRSRRGGEPFGPSWAADLALLAGAAVCAARGYNDFTPDSYAPYWAALPVLAVVVLADRVGRRWPTARLAVLVVPAVAALLLITRAYVGLYSDDVAKVETPRGTFNWYARGGPELGRTVRYVNARSKPGDTMLAFPADPGILFLSGRPSAVYESTFPPGTLDTVADQRAVIRQLRRRPAKFIVLAAQRTDNYGFPRAGVDYDRVLFRYLRPRYRRVATFGDVTRPTRDSMPGRAFTVWRYAPR